MPVAYVTCRRKLYAACQIYCSVLNFVVDDELHSC